MADCSISGRQRRELLRRRRRERAQENAVEWLRERMAAGAIDI